MTHTTEPTIDEILDAIEIFDGDDSNGKEYQAGYNDMALACRLMKEQIRIEVKQAVSDQVAKARYDIAEEMGKMLEIQGVNGTWNYDPYMHGMYNGMEFCHALVKGVEPKYREAPKEWLADIPMPKNAKATQTDFKRSKE